MANYIDVDDERAALLNVPEPSIADTLYDYFLRARNYLMGVLGIWEWFAYELIISIKLSEYLLGQFNGLILFYKFKLDTWNDRLNIFLLNW